MKLFPPMRLIAGLAAATFAAACGSVTEVPATPSLVIPTPPTATLTVAAQLPEPSPTTAVPATPTPLPPPPTSTLSPAASETPAPSATPYFAGPTTYRVVYVESGDSLNVRDAAGVDNDVIATLAPGAAGIKMEVASERVGASRWVEISREDLGGWVNDAFLTEVVPSDIFCADDAARKALDDLITGYAEQRPLAMTGQDQDSLRGLRVRHDWWNPEVQFSTEALTGLFADGESRDWGSAMGSGLPLQGSFKEIIHPLLEQDLLGGTEFGCNEILHGATAGLVQLPPAYEGVNFYSVHRPPPEDGNEFDWGTWVVGIEHWQGRYIVTFLIHYAYEI